MSRSMIFDIGFNHCCRNWYSKNMQVSDLNLRLTCNYMNQTTSVTEICILEFFGEWAKVLSFVQPGMDMKIEVGPPSGSSYNDQFILRNLTSPELIESKFAILSVLISEHSSDPYRTIGFDSGRKLTSCESSAPSLLPIPNHWQSHKRAMVEKIPSNYRPLTSITTDVAVINVIVGFIANAAPGPYKFTTGASDQSYVRTHAQVCDYGFRNLSLAGIRNDDMRDVPCFHLHLQIDGAGAELKSLPWLTTGDVIVADPVKPWFVQKQVWNLLHKQKKFGDTKVLIFKIDDFDESKDKLNVLNISGDSVSPSLPESSKTEIRSLQKWMKNRLAKESIVGSVISELNDRESWIGGRDIVARIISVNKFSCSIFVTDYSVSVPVEVRLRTSQPKISDTMDFIFFQFAKYMNKEDVLHVLMRNVRSAPDGTVFCSIEHITRVPNFSFDAQRLNRREKGEVETTRKVETSVEEHAVPVNAQQMPVEWQTSLFGSGDGGCVESGTQIEFDFVPDNDTQQNFDPNNNSSQVSCSQLQPRELEFDSQLKSELIKKQRMSYE
jgi:hypothetical protein